MAVEIPVVVDIEGGFKDAARRTPQAARPLIDQVERVADRMGRALAKMQKATTKPLGQNGIEGLNAQMSRYANTARLAAQQMLKLGEAQGRVTIGRMDIKALSSEVTVLANKWNAMQLGSKFDDNGKLRVRAQELIDKMSTLTSRVIKYGNALSQTTGRERAAASGIEATNLALTHQSTIFGRLTKYLSAYTLLFAGFRFIHNIRETTAELELQRVALGGILQDTERAEDLFRQIKAAALKSPFEIKDLVSFTKQLSAYRIETDKLFDVTMRLADVSAGLGVDMSRLVLAYGQVRAASVLRGQELRQFTEAGIPLVDELAKKFRELGREGTTTADVFELISKRAVPFSMIEQIFNDMTDAGGIFYKMQEKQSETLKGQWMKLRDAITIMYDEMGNTGVVHKAMTDLIQVLLALTRNWKETGRWLGTLVGMIAAYKAVAASSVAATTAMIDAGEFYLATVRQTTIATPKFIAVLVGETSAKKLNEWMTRRLIMAQYRLATATTVTSKAFWRLTAALLSNPYGAAAAAIAGLGLGIWTLVKNSREADITVNELGQSIEKARSAAEKRTEIEKLVDVYEELSIKSEKTAEEQERLARVSNELAKTYPSAISNIDAETDALIINIEKVKELTEAEQKLELARLKRDARRTRKKVERLEKEEADILAKSQAGGYYQFAGTPEETFVKYNERDLAKLGVRLNSVRDELKPLRKELQDLVELENVLYNQMYPIPGAGEGGGARGSGSAFSGWKAVLDDIHREKMDGGMLPVYTPDDIEKMEDVYSLYKKTKKAITEATTQLASLKALQNTLTDADARAANQKDIDQLSKMLEFQLEVQRRFGFDFSDKPSYQKPAYIVNLENQIKFMKDFKKGYEDLKNYLGSHEAFSEEMGIMNSRGKALGLSSEEQSMAAENLSEWYKQVREKAFKHLQRTAGVRGSLEDFLSQKITGTSNRAKMLRDFQSFLQSLWDAQTDIDTSKMKKTFEDALKEISEKVRRSETAKSFYDKILGLSGSESVATNLTVSVYGESGQDLKQNIQDELLRAFRLDPQKLQAAGKNLDDTKRALFKAIGAGNTKALRDLSKYVVDANMPNVQEILSRREKEDADAIQHYFDTFVTTMSAYEQELILEGRRDQGKEVAKKFGLPEDAVDRFIDQAIAKAYFDELRGTYAWTKAFENLEGVSTETIRNILQLMDALQHSSDLSPTEKRELANARERAEAVLAQRNAYEGLVKAYDRLSQARGDLNKLEDKGLKYKADGKTLTDDYIEALDREQKALKDIGDTAGEITSEIEAVTESTRKLVSAFASSEDASHFNEQMDNLSAILSGAKDATVGITRIVANPADIQGWIMGATGLAATVAAIANAAYAEKIRKANNLIKDQQELLDSLSEAYDHLQDATEKAFNSDYITNYQSRLANLRAQEAAYLAQAAAEREKGKKADEDQIKQYEKSAREAANAIAEMSEDLQQHFLGTDLTSAARDFASAWIDAYKEFGSTTDAIKEKFRDMITGMVTESLAAQIVQRQLKPIFDAIDELSGDGVLSVSDAAEVANMTKRAVGSIDLGLTNLMNALSGAGINLRTMGTGLTGISKDIQSASEESILGLAAGVNTQNFYMSQINANVIRIVEMMGGEPRSGQAPGQSDTGAGPTYQDQMLQYARNLPQMASDMAQIRNLLDKVIVKGSNYSVRVS